MEKYIYIIILIKKRININNLLKNYLGNKHHFHNENISIIAILNMHEYFDYLNKEIKIENYISIFKL